MLKVVTKNKLVSLMGINFQKAETPMVFSKRIA